MKKNIQEKRNLEVREKEIEVSIQPVTNIKMKYSNDETENDQLFFERCKALVRLSRAVF